MNLYPHTLVEDTPWSRMSIGSRFRYNFCWVALHLVLIVLTILRPEFGPWAIAAAAADLLFILPLVRFRPLGFPVQIRVFFASELIMGVMFPVPLLYVTAGGLLVMLVFDYCLLSRMISLFPWNRTVGFSFALIRKALFAPPRRERFEVG